MDSGTALRISSISKRLSESRTKSVRRQQHNFARGNRNGKRTNERSLLIGELQGAQFGDESGAHATLDDAHEGFDATEVVGPLTAESCFEMTEADQLIAEAMSFVEQPQRYFAQIGGTHRIAGVQFAALR